MCAPEKIIVSHRTDITEANYKYLKSPIEESLYILSFFFPLVSFAPISVPQWENIWYYQTSKIPPPVFEIYALKYSHHSQVYTLHLPKKSLIFSYKKYNYFWPYKKIINYFYMAKKFNCKKCLKMS